MRNNRYSGQTRSEFQKNYKRVNDIIEKSAGSKDKETILASTQAKLIKDEHKAINRAMAAKEIGSETIFDVFFRRAYELGSVPTQQYRDYVISKLLED
jgi:2-methylisocitrate lyase-like PEP mutase family enzyme